MNSVCPKCKSTEVSLLKQRTTLGYQRFRCKVCRGTFNERSDTVFNFLEYPTDLVLMVVRWRLRYSLSLRNLSEMMLERGFEFTHEAVRSWEERYTPLITQHLRRRRRGRLGKSWYVDETYIKIKGKWCYLYRAVDRSGALVDCRLSEQRDMRAAKQFFKEALEISGDPPDRVTTDKEVSYPRAIKEELGEDVLHRTNQYLNNLIEQDHRGIKQRYGPMKGFKSLMSASRFCRAYDELRNYYKASKRGEKVSLKQQRASYLNKTLELTWSMRLSF